MEAALVVPAVLFMMLLMVQTLFAVLQNGGIQFAAEQAADAAARHDATDVDGQQAADDVLNQLGVQNANVTVNRGVETVGVEVEAQIPKIIPLDISVSAESAAPIEEFLELEQRS